MRQRWLCSVLAVLLFVQTPLALAESPVAEMRAAESVQATLVAVNAERVEVSYVVSSGQIRTSRVSSPHTLVKLAKIGPGQKVVLQCRAVDASEQCVVEDVKKKAHWLKRVIIITAVIITFGAVMAPLADGSSPL